MRLRVEGPSGSVRLSGDAWRAILEVARLHGWTPMGTLPPPAGGDTKWSGEYWPPSGQRITAEDAGLLAQAVEQALSSGCQPESPAWDLHLAWNQILGTMDRLRRTGELVGLLRGGAVVLHPERHQAGSPTS